MDAASVCAGFSPEFRRVLLPRGATGVSMPVQQPTGQRWRALGRRPYGPKMAMCRWLDPFLVARSEFLEWTSENRLRHARLAGLRSDKDARDVREKAGAGAGRENSGRPDTGFFYWRYQVPAGLAQSEMLWASRSRTDPSVWAP
jgi:ATP-dependent DNA ligase